MSLIKHFGKDSAAKSAIRPLNEYFLRQKDSPDFPLTMALHTLKNLETTTSDERELYHYLLEDIIFSSIYATFYETIFITIKDNPTLALGLVGSFEKNADERERVIGEQTEYHVNFILNNGSCSGCPSCENHSDISELLPHWEKGDIGFFTTLYLGMQTIQFSMEHLLYDVIPLDNNIMARLTADNILNFRKFIYNYVETHLRK